jgi:hypothetical protein
MVTPAPSSILKLAIAVAVPIRVPNKVAATNYRSSSGSPLERSIPHSPTWSIRRCRRSLLGWPTAGSRSPRRRPPPPPERGEGVPVTSELVSTAESSHQSVAVAAEFGVPLHQCAKQDDNAKNHRPCPRPPDNRECKGAITSNGTNEKLLRQRFR